MKTNTIRLLGGLNLVLGAFVLFATSSFAAETNSIRLAVGPFFAPAGNANLQKAANELPDILMVALSQENRFQLVERDKVTAIWGELHLAEAGLTSANTIGKLGKILSCDWLVSGSFVQTGSGAQIWVKVINTQDSVVVDLQSVPYNQTNFSATARAIAGFLVQARSHSRPREFIALGKFNDQSISTTRENWAPRLVALIEKHFLAAGYGVVEREAVTPIFSEYQFQAAGLTGSSTNRVKLKPAFWIVDGGCKWLRDTQDKLSVTIRIQKMGGGEQMFSFTKPPGEELEKAVVATVQAALASTGSTTAEQAQAGEEKMRAEHLEQLVQGRGVTSPLRYPTNQTFITVTDASVGTRQVQVDPAFQAQRKNRSEEMLKTLQQAILLNPKDMRSKYMLGMSLFGMTDKVQSKQGEDLLQEVAASNDPTFATKAKNWLADVKSGKLAFEHDKFGNLNVVTRGQPASIPADANSTAQASNNLAAWAAKVNAQLNEYTNIATRAQSVAQIPSTLLVSGHYDDITAAKLWKRSVLIACGTDLKSYDLESRGTHSVNLPLKLKNPITAIEADTTDLWLGTGGGLIRISLANGTAREFGEKDGFPTPSISSLRLAGGRLFIGFGFQRGGAFGYLDTTTGKFTGLMSGGDIRKPWKEAVLNPPEVPVASITTLDGNNFWISSPLALQQFDLKANKWSLATPLDLLKNIGVLSDSLISLNSKYLVTETFLRCVAVCKLPEARWTCVNISTNQDENGVTSIATDPANPDFLWIGGFQGKITLLNMATSQIIAQGNIPSPGMVERIFATTDKVVFIAGGGMSGTYNLHCLDKSTLFGARPNPVPAAGQSGINPRDEFLQRSFSKFVPVQFQKGGNKNALVQKLLVKKNMFEYEDRFYCGFSFTVPQWVDGNFSWMNLLAKTEAQKDFKSGAFSWGIIAQSGQSARFAGADRHNLGEFPLLQQQFPYTHTVFTEGLSRSQLEPGKTYAIWFCFEQADLPDIGFSMTIDSARGMNEFGALPLR